MPCSSKNQPTCHSSSDIQPNQTISATVKCICIIKDVLENCVFLENLQYFTTPRFSLAISGHWLHPKYPANGICLDCVDYCLPTSDSRMNMYELPLGPENYKSLRWISGRSAELIRFLANERRKYQERTNHSNVTRGPRIFLHFILCMYY